MLHLPLQALCILLFTLRATKASNVLNDLDTSFPALDGAAEPALSNIGVWHLPDSWRKASVENDKTLIDPTESNSTYFGRLSESLIKWQRRMWTPLQNIETADAEEASNDKPEPSSWFDKFVRNRTPQNDTQSVVNDNQMISTNSKAVEPGIAPAEAEGGAEASSDRDDQWKSAMPDANLINGLRCVPVVSFTACLDHCFAVLPAATETGEDLTDAFLQAPVGRRKWFDTSAFYANLWTSSVSDRKDEKTEKDARSAGRKNHARDGDSSKILDWAQKEQLSICLFSVCARDYLKAALPGCIDPSGSLVNPSTRVNRTDLAPDSNYEELNFYNPQKLAFYSDLGYFTFSRVWDNFFPEGAIFGWMMIPIWTICLLIVPILIVTWANPVIDGSSPASARRGRGEEFATNVHMCDDLFLRYPSWRWVQKTIKTLGSCAELLITFGYSLGFFVSGLIAGTAVHRLLPATGLSRDEVEMTGGRSLTKGPDGYRSLAQEEGV